MTAFFRLARILGACVILAVAPSRVWSGPVSSTAPPPPKIEEIEKAGEALSKGRAEEAYMLLIEAVRKNPTLPPARLMFARMLLSINQARPGREALEQAAVEEPEHPEIYLSFAAIALGEGRVSDAILNSAKALELSQAPRWTADQKKNFQREARLAMATAYEARGDWPAARGQLFAWLELEPKSGPVRQRLARALFYMNKPDEALTELTAAVKDDATLDPPLVYMGRLWASRQEFQKAQEQFDAAVKKEPDNFKVHLAYADFLINKGDTDAAKIHVEKAAKLDPKAREVRQFQGILARYVNNLKEAARIFQELFNESPGELFVSNQLALVLADMSEETEKRRAVQYAEMNARQYPRSADALATLGYVYFRTGNMERAQQALAQSVSGGQASSDTAYFLALVMNERKEYEEAKKLLKGAINTPGSFVFRKEAKTLYDKLEKETVDNKKANESKDPPKSKG